MTDSREQALPDSEKKEPHVLRVKMRNGDAYTITGRKNLLGLLSASAKWRLDHEEVVPPFERRVRVEYSGHESSEEVRLWFLNKNDIASIARVDHAD